MLVNIIYLQSVFSAELHFLLSWEIYVFLTIVVNCITYIAVYSDPTDGKLAVLCSSYKVRIFNPTTLVRECTIDGRLLLSSSN